MHIDQLFTNRLGSRLERFSRKSDYLWNFRCPICGDSQTHKHKARGYIYNSKNKLYFHCHNCGLSLSFPNFLKRIDINLYKEYLLEVMKNSKSTNVDSLPRIKERIVSSKIINLPTINSLSKNHIAYRFLNDRLIPKKYFTNLYFAENFKFFLDEIYPNNEKKMPANELRLIIPFYSENNILEGFQGRAILKNNNTKYITILLNENSKKIFGLERLNFQKKIYVVEGPFDSLFLDNAVAAMESSLITVVEKLGQEKDYIFVYDNEKRNAAICSQMKKTIDRNFSIFIWPKQLRKYKDINDAILGGYTSSELMSIIDNNTFSDLRAKLEFENWRK
ncbi:MAG: DNA primase [Candidatus Paceibacterota bacterium]